VFFAESEIGNHPDVCLRFLPIIEIADGCDSQKLLRFVQFGCDDIVTMPLTSASVLARLEPQIESPKDHCQTETDFGPDRRQHKIAQNRSHSGRGQGDRPVETGFGQGVRTSRKHPIEGLANLFGSGAA
jgi:hypothetical protein